MYILRGPEVCMNIVVVTKCSLALICRQHARLLRFKHGGKIPLILGQPKAFKKISRHSLLHNRVLNFEK